MTVEWDRVIVWLTLIRLGQELGADSPAARAVAAMLDLLLHRAGT